MPRCYMVKKALCNKYINSVARGFESRGRGRSTPSPTNVQPPDSPLKVNPCPVAPQETQSSEGKDGVSPISPVLSEFSSEFSSDLPLQSQIQRVQDLLEDTSNDSTVLVVQASSRIQRDQDIQQTEKLVDNTSPSKKCTIISIDTFPPGRIPILRSIKETTKDQSKLTLVEKSPLILIEKTAPTRFHRVQDVIENAIEECTEVPAEKCPSTQYQKQDLKENVIYKCSDSSDKFPSRRLKRVQDVIEDVIDQCTPPTVQTKASLPTKPTLSTKTSSPRKTSLPTKASLTIIPTAKSVTTTVITRTGTSAKTNLQPVKFLSPTSPPHHPKEAPTRQESALPIKSIDDLRLSQSSPASSTEGCTSSFEMLSPFKSSTSLSDGYSTSSKLISNSSNEYQSTNDGIGTQLFRDRSAAETEAAHDLLELSRSLPPLPQPSVTIGPQNVIKIPSTDVQEMRVYQRNQPVYQVNTIQASDLTNGGIYQYHQGEIIYEPSTTTAQTIVHQAPGGVFIPLSPVQEILFTYATPSVSSSMIAEKSIGCQTSLTGTISSSMNVEKPVESQAPSIGSVATSIGSTPSSMGMEQLVGFRTPSIGSVATSVIAEPSIGFRMQPIGSVSMPSQSSSMTVEKSIGSRTPTTGSVSSSMIAEKSIGSRSPTIGSMSSSMVVEKSIVFRSASIGPTSGSMVVEQSIGSRAPSIAPARTSMIVEQSIESRAPSIGSSTSSTVDQTPGSMTSMIVEQSIGSRRMLMMDDQSVGSQTQSMNVEQPIRSVSSMIVEQSVGSRKMLMMDGPSIGSQTPLMNVEQPIGSVTSIMVEQPVGPPTPPMNIEQPISSVMSSMMVDKSMETVTLLTPPISECSSDIENNNPNSQFNLKNKEVQTITEPAEVKVSAYTYDTLLVADGRSKNRKIVPLQQKDTPEAEPVENLEVSKCGRYVCCECGKQYATSSNLSRHKQTHRSIDSHSAKKCVYCGKAYVSMPALAMHVLTHKLTHSCGICGKMFSRPWLLQGHLRSHTGEKPYGCAHCGKAFADRSNLRAHMQTHSSDKNYECPKCRKSFALKSYLNKHLESACQRENGDDSSNDVDSIVSLN